MDGKNTPAISPVDAVTQRRPSGVLISYAHDPEGRRMAAVLLRELRDRGCDVISDHELPLQNPSSLPAWMDDQIARRVVLCLLSPGYLHAFEDVAAEDISPRKGVRYELRAVRQRIYDHEGRSGCPVIPVAPTTFHVEMAPATLRALDISRVDPETGVGTDQLAARIAKLEDPGGHGAMSTTEQVPPTSSRRLFRQVVYNLEDDLPAEKAIELVGECLRLAEDPDLSTDLVHAFGLLAEVIKDQGQVSLMRTLTAGCIRVLRSTTPLLHWEHRLESRVLICGTAWYLQRDHFLQEALDEARRGIRIAEQYDDRRMAAFGKQSVGRIQRLLAEDSRGLECDHHLSASLQSLTEATALFSAIDGRRVRRSEVGACLSLSARTQLTRYRMLNDDDALGYAEELTRQAGEVLTPSQRKDRRDLAILRAEVAAANRRYADGRRLLGNTIESMIAEPGEHYSEILARAYVARAHVTLVSRRAKSDALADLDKARTIFRRQELNHAAAACEWTMLTTDSKSVTQVKFTRADALLLEDLTTDPRTRLAAVAKLAQQTDRIGRQPPGGRVDWASLVDQVRFE
ncbi:MAG: hypothetical protein GEV28_27405 [Actinophytocola sp.]|uniref:toll/interleukin-1 receptor domain-containing protein n=1 Tax=Actinophytocola sp. TaxID=1872138 RepID=UPI0013234621|nr:toll/interleukin-1 receptor domain-containing protein [Actinophytocola sp.]MPZ83917.1 hypothetical protein [Actinophytocola sp.]